MSFSKYCVYYRYVGPAKTVNRTWNLCYAYEIAQIEDDSVDPDDYDADSLPCIFDSKHSAKAVVESRRREETRNKRGYEYKIFKACHREVADE